MDYAVILQELAVALHEISGSKPFGRLLHLRVRESEPDFAHLICSKKADGVSRLHGEVSRHMWNKLWKSLPLAETPIDYAPSARKWRPAFCRLAVTTAAVNDPACPEPREDFEHHHRRGEEDSFGLSQARPGIAGHRQGRL